MAEPRRAWMKLTPDSDSAPPKTYSTHSEIPRSETFFLLCGCVIYYECDIFVQEYW